MKKFFVLKRIGSFEATVSRSFEQQEQADTFCRLLCDSESNESIKYFVCRVVD